MGMEIFRIAAVQTGVSVCNKNMNQKPSKPKPSHPWKRDTVGNRNVGTSAQHKKALAEVRKRAKMFAK